VTIANNKTSKVAKPLIYFSWFITGLVSMLAGYIAINNIVYIEQSIKVSASVLNKTEHQVRYKHNNTRTASALHIVYQYQHPHQPQKFELVSELAPLLYPFVEIGETIPIYYNALSKPQTRLSHPVHFWLTFLLCSVFLSFFFYITFQANKSLQAGPNKNAKMIALVSVFFFIPTVIQLVTIDQQGDQLLIEQTMQKNWPSWPAFEQAVAKPDWWDKVAINYFDPMSYTSEEFGHYVDNNKGHDKYQRSFKVTYALMLRHQDDPYTLAGLLGKGTTREFIPLYEFFLAHFMLQQWQGEYCSQPCNDATQMVEMAGSLLSMKLDENQLDYSRQLINDIMKYKYERGNNRGKFYFLYGYRRLLEHEQGKEKAKQILAPLVEKNLQQAINQGLTTQQRQWRRFWTSSQREIGIYSQSK